MKNRVAQPEKNQQQPSVDSQALLGLRGLIHDNRRDLFFETRPLNERPTTQEVIEDLLCSAFAKDQMGLIIHMFNTIAHKDWQYIIKIDSVMEWVDYLDGTSPMPLIDFFFNTKKYVSPQAAGKIISLQYEKDFMPLAEVLIKKDSAAHLQQFYELNQAHSTLTPQQKLSQTRDLVRKALSYEAIEVLRFLLEASPEVLKIGSVLIEIQRTPTAIQNMDIKILLEKNKLESFVSINLTQDNKAQTKHHKI